VGAGGGGGDKECNARQANNEDLKCFRQKKHKSKIFSIPILCSLLLVQQFHILKREKQMSPSIFKKIIFGPIPQKEIFFPLNGENE
jgi:hypothetical protein